MGMRARTKTQTRHEDLLFLQCLGLQALLGSVPECESIADKWEQASCGTREELRETR